MFPIYCTIISNKLQESAVFSAKRGQRAGLAARYEPQATKKFFGAAVFQKCCRGVGEQPTFAKQIQFCSLFFLLQLHFLKLTNSQFDCLCETSCKFGQGNGAIAARWQAKAGVEPPFAGCERPFFLRAGFSVKHFRCNCSTGTVARCLFLIQVSQGGAVLFAPPRKAVAFLTTPSVCQKHGTGISLPAGSDQGYSP